MPVRKMTAQKYHYNHSDNCFGGRAHELNTLQRMDMESNFGVTQFIANFNRSVSITLHKMPLSFLKPHFDNIADEINFLPSCAFLSKLFALFSNNDTISFEEALLLISLS